MLFNTNKFLHLPVTKHKNIYTCNKIEKVDTKLNSPLSTLFGRLTKEISATDDMICAAGNGTDAFQVKTTVKLRPSVLHSMWRSFPRSCYASSLIGSCTERIYYEAPHN